MSYGIPAVISNDAYINTKLKKNKEVVVFNNTKELIKKIFYLIENKNFSNILSNNSQKVIKRQYNLNKALSKYNDIIQ